MKQYLCQDTPNLLKIPYRVPPRCQQQHVTPKPGKLKDGFYFKQKTICVFVKRAAFTST